MDTNVPRRYPLIIDTAKLTWRNGTSKLNKTGTIKTAIHAIIHNRIVEVWSATEAVKIATPRNLDVIFISTETAMYREKTLATRWLIGEETRGETTVSSTTLS